MTVKPRTILDKRNIFRADVEPTLGSKALASITADDLCDLVEVSRRLAAIRTKVFPPWAKKAF